MVDRPAKRRQPLIVVYEGHPALRDPRAYLTCACCIRRELLPAITALRQGRHGKAKLILLKVWGELDEQIEAAVACPVSAHPYCMDHRPSTQQRRLPWLLAEGYEAALYPDGSYRWGQSDEIIPVATRRAGLGRHWITGLPGLALFNPHACRLTPRGRAALGR
jgi:hypothetical protein